MSTDGAGASAPARSANLALLLARSIGRHPDRTAVEEQGGRHSYAQLGQAAAGVAAELARRGIGPGERVAIFLERDARAIGAYFGSLAAGCTVTVVNDRLRPRQIEHMLRHCGATGFLTSSDMLARQHRAIATEAACIDVLELEPGGEFAPVAVASDAIAQIIYTSGSTGLPKGVAFTHGAVGAGVETCVRYLGLSDADRVASLLPISSVYGLNQLLSTILVGGTLVISQSPVPLQIAADIAAARVTVVAAVPPLWLQLLSTPELAERLASVRVLQNAGGHLPTDAVRRLRAACPHASLFLQYGMTETFRSTFLDPGEVDPRPASIGRPVPGSEIFVLRDDLTECEAEEVGELVFRGPMIASGYWADSAATARVFRANPRDPDAPERVVFSGDLVKRDADGFLYYVARRDRVIKTLGFRIGPDEVVDVLFASGEIDEAVVSTEPDPVRGERIVASVVLSPNGSRDRLARFCGAELPRHMQPARIDVYREIPRLPSGKYDLDALRAQRERARVAAGSE